MDTATFFKPQFYAHALYVKNEGTIEFETAGGSLALQSGTLTGDITFTLPNSLGTAGQYLKTDGNGIMMWDNVPNSSAGGNLYEIQINDGEGGFTGNPNFTIDGNRMYVGNSSSSSRIVFSGGSNVMERNCYIRSSTPDDLQVYATNLNLDGNVVSIGSSGILNAIADGPISITSHYNNDSAIQITASGENEGSIIGTAKKNIHLISENTTENEAIKLSSNNGGIKLESRRLFYNTMNVSIGDGELFHINSRAAPGSMLDATASVLYFYIDQDMTGGDFHCDLTSYGADGQVLKIIFDNRWEPIVKLYINFGEGRLVSGSGLNSSLYFETVGQSSELIYKIDYDASGKWFILNTGATVI